MRWQTRSEGMPQARNYGKPSGVNLLSDYALARAAVPAMLKQGRGATVNVASRTAIDHAASAAA